MLELLAALRLAPPAVADALAERFRPQLVRLFAAEFGLPHAAASGDTSG
ncbi:hypothetical protein [Embleya sp. NBC_00896]|nr:hypothetical protein OG928_36535 [Embleya sp. NBC_00896]